MGKELPGTTGKEKADARAGISLAESGIDGGKSINSVQTDPRRKLLLLLGLTGILALLAARLFWIQVLRPHRFSAYEVDLVKNSVLQRQKSIVLDTGRGDMYDRNLKPLTGKTIRTAIIFPVHPDYTGSAEQLRKVSEALGVTADDWKSFVKQVKEPFLWTGSLTNSGGGKSGGQLASSESGESVKEPLELSSSQIALLEASGLSYVQVTDYKTRYPDHPPAAQVIGYIGQNPERISGLYARELAAGHLTLTSEIGVSGLEKTFESRLRGIGERTLSVFTDAGKRPLGALNARLISPDQSRYPLQLMTTLDSGIQRSIEERMTRRGITKGAVVVLDAANADIVAMASKPSFHPGEINAIDGDWANLGVKAAAPGSIFKTVVAAAALEKGVVKPDETFDCHGAWGKYGFTCWKKEGHGKLTFEEGFAQSCNIVFGEVMRRLDSDELETYARNLGLLTPVGWKGSLTGGAAVAQLDGEEGGQLFGAQTPRDDEGVRLQTAIGQRDVQVTPLQAANLVVTVLHRGKARSPRLVKEVRFRDGLTLDSFPPKFLPGAKEVLSPRATSELLREMRLVVRSGTAGRLDAAKWPLAGKTGTAQVQSGPHETVNQWFIGYGPVDAPRYAVAVVIREAAPEAPSEAVPLAREIMDMLADQPN
ncbi:penicillin-binding protein [Paenibacillus chitinolyticus]|uniref:Penicillin-binding protein n=1 Tax=Paenibacillus chitinolyticus TaxID=79263 RepID=A0A410X1U3_9BACL|nr:penicillin-binding transpeptidase domain-containing protein [Paenibacillus chitinolyticus]MCY9592669.1 penicillin-binding transpeptidase domain-containing protein [Paenibacillus chitinolyticus]MCY9594728.1 penicillin-binding transpeptidase domain-containing protein [Paenibacillus chitinolyticus]QAV20580.1 penicillin-binding protein [Paenibacillus chitinolyticus]